MGTYYGVKKVIKEGKRLGSAISFGKKPIVENHEAIIGIVFNGVWAIAPDLTDEKEFKYFFRMCSEGSWLSMEIYKVPKSELGNFPNEGRVEYEELKQAISEAPEENRYKPMPFL